MDDVLPAAPWNLRGRSRTPAATAFGGANFLQPQRLLRWGGTRQHPHRLEFSLIILVLEGKDHARRHHHGGGKPGDEIIEPWIHLSADLLHVASARPQEVQDRKNIGIGLLSGTATSKE